MPQAAVKLVLKLVAPNRRASRAVAQGVPRLYHEALNHPMEQHAVVVAVTRVRDEILDCLGALVREELQVDLPIGGIDADGARQRPPHVRLRQGQVVARRLLVENVTAKGVALRLQRLSPREQEEARPLEGTTHQRRILFFGQLCARPDLGGRQRRLPLEEGQVGEALGILHLAEQPDQSRRFKRDHLDAHNRGVQEQLARLVKHRVGRRRVEGGTVFSLYSHAPSKVERLQPVHSVAVLLHLLQTIQGLVVRAPRLPAPKVEDPNFSIGRTDGEVFAIRRDCQCRRPRLGLGQCVQVRLRLKLERGRFGQLEGVRAGPVFYYATGVGGHNSPVRRVVLEQEDGRGVQLEHVPRGAVPRRRVKQPHLWSLGVGDGQKSLGARVGLCPRPRPTDPLTAARHKVELDPGDHVEGEHVEHLEPPVGRR
mmetsp:Transcript_27372/g.88407  ORF Transcript_27372/g.88407 Transcript_27372/m.88407 type:complete len:425 (-) Transcript_27372:335-1609(-)